VSNGVLINHDKNAALLKRYRAPRGKGVLSATRLPRPAKPLFQQIHHSLHSLDTDAQIPV
jgi:hypothetical protein